MARETRQRNRVRSPRARKSMKPAVARFFRGLVLFVIVCGLLTCTYMVLAKASRPYMISYTESKEIVGIRKEKLAAEAENKRLKEERDYLLTVKGKEAEARRLGWVKEGEVAIVVQQPEQPTVAPAELEKRPVPKKSKWVRLKEEGLSMFLFGRGKTSSP